MSVNSPWKQKATTGGEAREVPDAGAHPAVLVALIDLGTHSEEFKDDAGKVKVKDIRKVQFVWELTGEPIKGQPGKNHIIGRDYNLFFSQKAALRKLVEAWRGKALAEGEEFDIAVLLGKPCLVTLSHGQSARGNAYAKLEAVGPLPKGTKAAPPKIAPFSRLVDSADLLPDWLPYIYGESVGDFVARAKEIAGHTTPRPRADAAPADKGGTEDEVPF